MLARVFTRFILISSLAFPIASNADTAELIEVPVNPAASIALPAGFKLNVFANLKAANSDFFRGARFMAFGPDGNLYISTGMDNQVLMLPDANKDGVADQVVVVADNLNAPQGLTFVKDKLLVANQDGVVQLIPNNGKWPAKSSQPLISGLSAGGHKLKTLKLGPDGYLYLNVGSSCNVCDETDAMRATIHRYSLNGQRAGQPAGALETLGRHAQSPVWARGLRNSQGFAWHPQTGAMFATNNGSDMRADTKGGKVNDEIPPEHLNRIEPGKNYGWPHCWGVRDAAGIYRHTTDPNFPGADGLCDSAQAPEITFPSHSTPLGITFLNDTKWPSEYKTDAIVALHGSWNRQQPSGYKLVRVKFKQDKPVEVVDFATGWLNNKSAWGRPVDVIVGPDGALYVSDDRAGMIYRITYKK
ncbi:MAG: sorbosone dehydrogenase family protein [Methylophilaceae bacterium]